MYVYKFLNNEGEIIYIGRTEDMNNRQSLKGVLKCNQ
jgi:excinuclease UvrABC nuclease subunit